MTRQHEDQSSLFDEKRPRIAQQPKQMAELAAAVNGLLLKSQWHSQSQ